MKKRQIFKNLSLMLIIACLLTGCTTTENSANATKQTSSIEDTIEEGREVVNDVINDAISDDNNDEHPYLDSSCRELGVKEFTTEPYVNVNNGVPFFTDEEKTTEVFEIYAELDELGRCGVAYANICQEIMPTEDRGAIGQVKPSGWQTVKYDIVDGKYLYNRCHLIGFQLAGENANNKNLITGTRYLNIDGMLGHENMIAEYVKETNNHVLYRVTPLYRDDNLVASGVLMEAYSVEDNGEGIQFCIYAYNVQPGVKIDYATGKSALIGDDIVVEESVLKNYTENPDGTIYTVNIESKKFHYEDCGLAIKTKDENKESYNGTVDWLLDNGYTACGRCKPQ